MNYAWLGIRVFQLNGLQRQLPDGTFQDADVVESERPENNSTNEP